MQNKLKQAFSGTSLLRNKTVAGSLCVLPLIFYANIKECVHIYAHIRFVIRNGICYTRFLSLLFYLMSLGGPSLSSHRPAFFFFNSGIAFHPKDASCFIHPSSTRHLGYFQFWNHPRAGEPKPFTVSNTHSPNLASKLHMSSTRLFSFANAPHCVLFYTTSPY